MLHYRCLKSYIPNPEKKRVSDTTDLLPETLTFPRVSSQDAAEHAAMDLTHALPNPTPTSPLITLVHKKIAALRKLAEIFTKASPPLVTQSTRVHTPDTIPNVAHMGTYNSNQDTHQDNHPNV